MLVEVVEVEPIAAPLETLLADLTDDGDVEYRLVRLVDTLNPLMIADEARMRAALRVYLDTWLDGRRNGDDAPPVREGRRIRWLDEVLEPVRADLPAEQWRRLRAALDLTLGIDAVVVMKDVCHLDNDEFPDVLRWAATALLRAGLEDAATGRSPATP